MKNLLTLIFVISSTFSFSQSNFSINLLGNVNYSFSKYSYNNGQFYEGLTHQYPLGKSLHLEIEFSISPKMSIVGGLRYAHNIIYPHIALPPSYGTALPLDDGSSVIVFLPYLSRHEFQIITLPISFKRYYSLGEKVSLYSVAGVIANFKFKEVEIYKTSEWEEERLNEQGVENHFAYTDNQISLFSTAIELGVGMDYKITDKLSLILQTSANVLEYRKANAKFKKNGDMLWEDAVLPIGQVSLGVGVRSFF